jgi:hypothetical protein
MRSTLERFAPLIGVLAVVLTVIGIVLPGSTPDFLDKPQEIADFYADDSGKLIAAAYIGLLGTVAFLWFLGVLRSRLRRAEGPHGRLSTTALGGGIVAAAMFLLVDGFNLAGALRADEDGRIDPAVAATLYDMSGLSISLAAFGASVLVVATAALAFRTRVLPRWLGWISVLLGIGLLTPISYIFVGIFLLWLLAVAVLLFLQPVADETASTPVARVPD